MDDYQPTREHLALLSLFETSDDLVALIDVRGALIELNPAGRRLASFAPDEVVTGNALSFLFVDLSAQLLVDEALPEARRHGRWVGQTVLRATGLPLQQTVISVGDGFLISARGDDQHRAMFETLRASEERFRTLIEQLKVGVVVQGRRSEILLCNDFALELFGLTRDQMMQRTSYDPSWSIIREDGSPFPPEDRPVTRAAQSLSPIRNVVMGIDRARTKDRIWLQVDAIPLLDDHGQLIHIVATLTDLTERKRLEDSLLHAKKLESIGRLAGGIAHDFNNLLAVILGNLELAMLDASATAPIRGELEAVAQAAKGAARLTSQILTFARKQVTRPQRVTLGTMLEQLAEMLRSVLGRDIEVVVRVEPGVWPVLIDPAQLEQVLINLAVNARDAMPQGGRFTLAARRSSPDSRPSGATRTDFVELEISDSGAGMPPEVLRHAFEPFFTTKELGRGTGLGLAIVHGIVNQGGGHIEISSTVGVGTTFRLYLPRAPDEIVDSITVPVTPASTSLSGSETLLFVEDEPLVLRVGVRILTTHGYRVIDVADGPSALVALARPGAIDLLVTDIRMRPMDGLELMRHVRASHPDLPIIFVSGFSDATNLDLGPRTWFVPKPYSGEALLAAVRTALDSRRATST